MRKSASLKRGPVMNAVITTVCGTRAGAKLVVPGNSDSEGWIKGEKVPLLFFKFVYNWMVSRCNLMQQKCTIANYFYFWSWLPPWICEYLAANHGHIFGTLPDGTKEAFKLKIETNFSPVILFKGVYTNFVVMYLIVAWCNNIVTCTKLLKEQWSE